MGGVMTNAAYKLGGFLGRNMWPIIGLATFVAAGVWWSSKGKPATPTEPTRVAPVATTKTLEESCRGRLAAIRLQYKQQMAANQFSEAVKTVSECSRVLGDAELSALRKDAAVKFHLAAVNKPGQTPGERADAIEGFAADHPEEAKPLLREVFGLRSKQTDINVAADKARRRSQGVRVGMTAEDVLASSWGAPRDVNRTTTAYGVREQWVYTGGYLYFENGKLTTIQN